MLSQKEILQIFDEVKLAPSAHNTQPGKWKINNTTVSLSCDSSRMLPVADSSNHDMFISLGAGVEALKISLSARSYKLVDESVNYESETIFKAAIEKDENIKTSKRFGSISKRYCHRHSFGKLASEEVRKIQDSYHDNVNTVLITSKDMIREIMQDYDEAAYSFLKGKAYFQELYNWLRLSAKHASFYKDGLNIDSMGLSFFEKLGAKFVMRPSVFNFLKRIGLGKVLTSELGKNLTASGVLFIVSDSNINLLEQGALFYREWLDLEKNNLAGCPISSLIDHPEYKKKWKNKLGLSDNQVIINALKIGPYTENLIPKRCRLDTDQILSEVTL